MQDLGELIPVDPREVWRNEAVDFTPWIRDNPAHLEQVLKIGITITAAEHGVGPFRADLFGTDVTNNCLLVIENQLEPTDHAHLGALLTYAAGTDAATVVWVAGQFRDEHRQAIDWLNMHTDETIRFFGVQIRVVRIGQSGPAPNFEVVAMPNDWEKEVRAATAAQRRSTGRGPVETVKGTPWAITDVALANEVWDRLSDRARTLFDLLVDRPGEKFSSTELCGVLGVSTSSQVAGVLSWPGIYCKREGKALFFFWDVGDDGASRYWMDPAVADVFRAARDGTASS